MDFFISSEGGIFYSSVATTYNRQSSIQKTIRFESNVIDKSLRWIRPVIKNIAAYHVADASGLIKLDAMENPYHLSEGLLAELRLRLSQADLNRYPDPAAGALRNRLRQVMAVPEGRSIVLGNGSDELIQMLAMAVADNDNVTLMSFEPGFVMYRMISAFAGINYVGTPLLEDFTIDMAATRKAIEQHQPAVIFIAYPNNPSANCYDEKQIEEIISIAPGMVVLDEAYHPFAQTSFMPRLPDYDNLLVMRTVSKMGLAGIRLGLLCGHPDIIGEIDKIRLPYNINVLTQIAAELVLENMDELEQQAKLIRDERESLIEKMRDIDRLQVFPSQANFILFRVLDKSAGEVFESIRRSGVLIKNMKADEGLLKNCLRVTVGTPDENVAFVKALSSAMDA
jgi:histidinol-phosphate aminotransferase